MEDRRHLEYHHHPLYTSWIHRKFLEITDTHDAPSDKHTNRMYHGGDTSYVCLGV